MARHNRLGRQGERIAARFLRRKGLKILARNFKTSEGELDLVAIDCETLVFIEVKTRRSEGDIAVEESVTAKRRRRIIRTARIFAQSLKSNSREHRYDVAVVLKPSFLKKATIRWIRDAFSDEYRGTRKSRLR